MPVRDYAPPKAKLASNQNSPDQLIDISSRRKLRLQSETDKEQHLPRRFPPCPASYETEDRSLPSVSSF
jgi:hypothetical protein